MYTKEEAIYFMEQSHKILDIIEHKDELTQSDLQGAIEAVIMSTYLEGKNKNNEMSW